MIKNRSLPLPLPGENAHERYEDTIPKCVIIIIFDIYQHLYLLYIFNPNDCSRGVH